MRTVTIEGIFQNTNQGYVNISLLDYKGFRYNYSITKDDQRILQLWPGHYSILADGTTGTTFVLNVTGDVANNVHRTDDPNVIYIPATFDVV